MLSLLKRHEIQVLLRAEHTQREVAELAGVSERSVRRVAEELPVTILDDGQERSRRHIGRPSKVEPVRQFVKDLLSKEQDLKSVEILRRTRQQGYGGSKSALYELIATLRPAPVKLMTRFEGLPGEFSQHDFGQVEVEFLDGRRRRIHFFVSRLKYSRWSEVSIVADETTESLVRALVDHFVAFGGVPLLAVFDRPKTITLKWNKKGEVTEWNPTFAAVVFELGIGVELCWPYSPEQKGSSENLVGWVKGSFFKQRRFQDEEDMLIQLRQWLEEVNQRRPNRATEVIPAVRLAEERPRLRPVKVWPEQLALRIPVCVGPTAKVLYQTNTYSMPPKSIGISGTLFLYRERVRIVAGPYEADHPRLFGRHLDSTLPEHRAEQVAAVSGQRGKRYLKRQHLLQTGQAAWTFLTELLHRRPGRWSAEVDELHDQLQSHGPAALDAAFQAAVEEGVFGVEYVSHFLQCQVESTQEVISQ